MGKRSAPCERLRRLGNSTGLIGSGVGDASPPAPLRGLQPRPLAFRWKDSQPFSVVTDPIGRACEEVGHLGNGQRFGTHGRYVFAQKLDHATRDALLGQLDSFLGGHRDTPAPFKLGTYGRPVTSSNVSGMPAAWGQRGELAEFGRDALLLAFRFGLLGAYPCLPEPSHRHSQPREPKIRHL